VFSQSLESQRQARLAVAEMCNRCKNSHAKTLSLDKHSRGLKLRNCARAPFAAELRTHMFKLGPRLLVSLLLFLTTVFVVSAAANSTSYNITGTLKSLTACVSSN